MRYLSITEDDMFNGEGLRVVLWLSGCNHHCKGCQNPATWDPAAGDLFDENAERRIVEQLEKPYISGTTLSGGDPLYPANVSEVTALVRRLKQDYPNKNIWLYTGDVWEEIFALPLMEDIDVVVDGEFQEGLASPSLLWKGSSNQRVIDVQSTLSQEDPSRPILHCRVHCSSANDGKLIMRERV